LNKLITVAEWLNQQEVSYFFEEKKA
jgi:hypothetical protein